MWYPFPRKIKERGDFSLKKDRTSEERYYKNGQGIVEKLVYSGDGLIRGSSAIQKDGQTSPVTFIPFVAPSEVVEYSVHTMKKKFCRASLLSVIQPSPDRVKPLCSHFGECGGCQLQHISPEAHGKIKKGWIEEAFYKMKPFMDSDVEWLSLPPLWQWRKKISFHALRKGSTDWILGYWNESNSRIFQVKECPIFFHADEVDIIGDIKDVLHEIFSQDGFQLAAFESLITVSLLRIDQVFSKRSFALHISLKNKPGAEGRRGTSLSQKREKELITILKDLGWVQQASYSIDTGSQKKIWKNLFGTPSTNIEIEGIECKAPFHAFMQNHPTMSHAVWKDVVQSMMSYMHQYPSDSILDLYSGVGVTALLLARAGVLVDAVELSRSACKAFEETSVKYNLASKVRVFSCSAEEALSSQSLLKRSQGYRAWLMNPPREGASQEVMEALSTGSYGSFGIYTSCNPATLQRDIAILTHNGWRIRSVKGYDMFPMTTHFETVVVLYRA